MIIENRQDLTRLLKTAQAQAGISNNTLADRLDISTAASMSRTINKSDLSVTQLQRIAQALDCDLYIAFLPKDYQGKEIDNISE